MAAIDSVNGSRKRFSRVWYREILRLRVLTNEYFKPIGFLSSLKAKALSSSKVQLEDNAKNILQLEHQIAELQQQKAEQYNLLKRALTEEDRRKHSQQTITKEPSWTSLYSPSKSISFFSICR